MGKGHHQNSISESNSRREEDQEDIFFMNSTKNKRIEDGGFGE